MQKTILHNQSLLDVCLQHTGTIEGVFELAIGNDVSISDELKAGKTLDIPNEIVRDKDILNYYQAKGIQPACGLTSADKQVMEKCEGIGCWAIGVDFIVS